MKAPTPLIIAQQIHRHFAMHANYLQRRKSATNMENSLPEHLQQRLCDSEWGAHRQ